MRRGWEGRVSIGALFERATLVALVAMVVVVVVKVGAVVVDRSNSTISNNTW